jgi:hypothetical protein
MPKMRFARRTSGTVDTNVWTQIPGVAGIAVDLVVLMMFLQQNFSVCINCMGILLLQVTLQALLPHIHRSLDFCFLLT